MNETGHAYVFSVIALSKRWFDTLPGDLQGTMLTTAKVIEQEVTPWELDFLARQRKTWVEKGGELIVLSGAERMELMRKMGTVGDDIVRSKPGLKPLWDMLIATAKRSL